jgi:predicted dienelactone hydrolase
MKRGIAILVSLGAVTTVAYFTASQWAIRHETLTFSDPARGNRPVAVDIAVRRDKEMQANAGMIKLPVAILNHGNTVSFTEDSFLANVVAARGYMAISIQHDLPTDAPRFGLAFPFFRLGEPKETSGRIAHCELAKLRF